MRKINIALTFLLASCQPAFAGGEPTLSCPAPTVIKETVQGTCPYIERTEKVYITEEVVVNVPAEGYVLGMVGTGFVSNGGETDFGKLHNRDTDQELDFGSESDLKTLLVGYSSNGLFDFYEYGLTHGQSDARSTERHGYSDTLGINSSIESLEAFAQGKKTFVEFGRLGVHGLLGLGMKMTGTEITRTYDTRGYQTTVVNDSRNDVTGTGRVGLGLSFDLTDSVALVARGTYSHEFSSSTITTQDRCWNDATLSADDNGLEAGLGIRVSF